MHSSSTLEYRPARSYRCDDGEVWKVAATGTRVVGEDHVSLT